MIIMYVKVIIFINFKSQSMNLTWIVFNNNKLELL